jgi:hypothetical protein
VEGRVMKTIHDSLKGLNPLKKSQYFLLLRHIENRSIEFNTDLQKEIQKDLGLTQNEFKKALEWLINVNLVCIEENYNYKKIVFCLTDVAREMI